MGFFAKLFKKKSIEKSEWDEILSEKDSLNLKDPFVREQYVMNCLEEMKEASLELDRINAEYNMVTSYLTDIEEIEALKEGDRDELVTIAKHLHELRKAHDNYILQPSLLSEHEYSHMESLEDEIKDGLDKLIKEEDYKHKVKSDLRRIDKERTAYDYRSAEVNAALENTKGVATIALVASAMLIIILFLLQVVLELDVTLGYYIAVALAAVSITFIYIKYTDYEKEKRKVDNTINELILLENKVKIRYVNNKNLLDYLYAKYEVKSAAELKATYEKYLKEKAERKSFEHNEEVYETEVNRLLRIIRRYSVKDPERWIHQSDAIYDNREMVEIRHGLIGRRQKLRKQLEYNEQIALEASEEIKKIMKDYPEDASSLLDLVNKYEANM